MNAPGLVGQLVRLRPECWREHGFNHWGRGLGVGIVVDPTFELSPVDCDVVWPAGRCWELSAELEVVAPSSTAAVDTRTPSDALFHERKAGDRWVALRLWYFVWSWARTEAGLPGADSPRDPDEDLSTWGWGARARGDELDVWKGRAPIWTFSGVPRLPDDEELLEFSRRCGPRMWRRYRTKGRGRLGGAQSRALVEHYMQTHWRERLDRTIPRPLRPVSP